MSVFLSYRKNVVGTKNVFELAISVRVIEVLLYYVIVAFPGYLHLYFW